MIWNSSFSFWCCQQIWWQLTTKGTRSKIAPATPIIVAADLVITVATANVPINLCLLLLLLQSIPMRIEIDHKGGSHPM